MKVQLAASNLRHNLARTALSVAGVGFAIVLMFLQLGFLGAVRSTATLIYDQLEFDLVLRSPQYLHLCDARLIDRGQLEHLAAFPEVQSVKPFQIMVSNWQHPETGVWHAIVVIAVRPNDVVFRDPEIARKAPLLTDSEAVLIDRKTRWSFGPRNGRRFSDLDKQVVTDIGGKRVRIVDHFEMGTGLAANGAVLVNDDGFQRLSPVAAPRKVSLGLVRLKPGTDRVAFQRKYQKFLDANYQSGTAPVDLVTEEEVRREELKRWINETPVGTIFTMGVVLAFLVGAAIVYMVLSNDVANHLSEYATLYAMGYSQGQLSAVILQQALALALLAFLPAALVALALYSATSTLANIPVNMTLERLVSVLFISVLMCLLSGVFALRKLYQADPADLF